MSEINTGAEQSASEVNGSQSAIEQHIPVVSDGQTAVDCLAETTGISRQKLKTAMQKGCVWLEQSTHGAKPFIQRLRRAKKPLKAGEVLHLYYDEAVLQVEPPEAILLHDAGDYSIWLKPSGMLSQGSKWGDHCTIYRWAEQHLKPERPAFIVHRLDRPANGLIILAHKKQIAAAFSKMFEERSIEKHYRVLVEGDFSQVLAAGESVKTIRDEVDGKAACSHVRILDYDTAVNETLLDVHIETGRKHQIRKHLSGNGYPVVGDRQYGSGRSERDLQLQAASLRFVCPVTGDLREFGAVN